MPATAAERLAFRSEIGPVIAATVSALAALEDPAEREIEAPGLVPPALVDGPLELLEETIEIVAEAPDGLPVLAALATAVPPAAALRARAVLEELADPPRGLGALVAEEAWELDADEPVLGLALRCRREGLEGSQLFSFVLETPLSGGAIKDGFASGELRDDRLVQGFLQQARRDGVEPRSVDPAETVERVTAAARRGATAGLAPTPDGLVATAVFLRAAGAEDPEPVLEALAESPMLAEIVEQLEAEARSREVDALVDAAERWALDQGQEPDDAHRVAWAAQLMGDFRAHYAGGDVYAWSRDDVDELLLDWIPRKISLEEDEIETLPGSVAEVLTFLGATGRLSERAAPALARRAEGLAKRFADAAQDPASYGPAKAIGAAMLADDVDLADAAAVQEWINTFNARPEIERDAVLGPSLPRPAPARARRAAKARKSQRQARRRNRKP
jgi:hypothetical protein